MYHTYARNAAPPVPNRLPSTENFHLSVSSIAATVRGNTQNKGDTDRQIYEENKRAAVFPAHAADARFFSRLHFQAIFFLRTHHRARRLNKNRLTCG